MMTSTTQTVEETIKPHGGQLINRQVEGNEKEQLIEAAQTFPKITLNPWSISDLELIAIGGFSPLTGLDRKSTRLNSSHVAISYAVFCLKKKNYTYIN